MHISLFIQPLWIVFPVKLSIPNKVSTKLTKNIMKTAENGLEMAKETK
tara:strand:+ start:14746 stop:14889 length:144 start_codon:yes stop_codon:yes gene_type:complete